MTDFRTPQDNGDVIRWPGNPAGAQETGIEAFMAYWSSMRRGGDVPLRSQIDPREIEALLPNAFVAEKIAPGLARFRIAGSHLGDLMGMDVRGMPLSALVAPQSRTQLADALVDVFDQPATARLDLTSAAGFGRPAMTGTLLLLPLRSDLGDIARVLGACVTTGTPGRVPRRFSLSDTRITPLTVPGKTTAPRAAPQPAFAEPQARFRHASAPPRSAERSYLRLVKSD